MKKTWNAITAMLLAALLVLPLAPTAAAEETDETPVKEQSTVDPAHDTGSVTLTLQSASNKDVKVEGA